MKQSDGRRGAIRQKALKAVDLANMEAHGKREDESGKRRRVREVEPFVVGGLNLRELRADWMEGVKQQGNTAALHALVQYPTGLIDGTANDQQERMLQHAVRFMNDFHGGDAVFAARLDRDEKGRHSVDVFMMPLHDFKYKDGRRQKRSAVSKHTKAEAQRRYGKQNRRAQGSALQDAWFEYMRDEMGLDVLPPERKKVAVKDRLEPEVYAVRKERQKILEGAQMVEQAFDTLEADEAALAAREKVLAKRGAEIDQKIAKAGLGVDLVLREMSRRGRIAQATQQRAEWAKERAAVAAFSMTLKAKERLTEPPQKSKKKISGIEAR